MENKEQNC